MALSAPVAYEDAYSVIEPAIAGGVHQHPFDPACPVDVRFLRFGEKRDIRMNRHDYFEMLYLSRGEVVYEVQDRHFSMHAGDLFVIGGTLMHRMSGYSRGNVDAAVLYFLPDIVRAAMTAPSAASLLRPFLLQDEGFEHIVPAGTGVPALVFELMRRTAAELPLNSPGRQLIATSHLASMLALLMRHYAAYAGSEAACERRRQDLERLRPLFQYVDAHYASALTVADAAAVLRLSKSSFMRLFRQVTGDSFIGYLNRFRVAKAESLLASTGKPIAEISQEVGFYDQSYFGATFRRFLGMTPRQYRQRMSRPGEDSAL
jgi:AraC-like DNA-binding protein